MLKIIQLVLISLLILHTNVYPVESTHLKGTFQTNEFFKFLVKFGFQKTDRHHKEDTYGYIFGNITSKQNVPFPVTFAVLPKPYFVEYYKNRLLYDKSLACKRMFETLSTVAFDQKCNKGGKDFLRKIPCPANGLCADEDTPWNVIKGNQFTYVIQDLKQPS